MNMLLIDAGNSRTKWALVANRAWLRQGVLENAQADSLSAVFSQLPPPSKILTSNVAGEQMAEQLRTACAEWRCPIEFVEAREKQCGVRNLYEQIAQLGSDRWAALIAARQLQHLPCLVVNCGTATTVDALSADGEFLGGLILPGINMMQRSLATGAAQLIMQAGVWREFPRNTADAMLSGAIQATAGAIQLQFAALSGNGGAHCLLSGGAADYVQPHLELPLLREDNLVLRGLQIIGESDSGTMENRE